jgi:Clp amino terminal domain, pathogenicity island component
VFERYTEAARRVIFFARYEASQYGSPSIETEHLLLGLFREDKRLARAVLQGPGAAESIRKEIETQIVRGERISTSVEMPLSMESKRVLQYAGESAQQLGRRHVHPENLLLGILREEECMAARVLKGRCVGTDVIEQKIKQNVDSADSRAGPMSGPSAPTSKSFELQSSVKKLLEAWRTRNVEKVFDLFDDHGQFWDEKGDLHSGSDAKEALGIYLAAPNSEVESAVVKDMLFLAESSAGIIIAWPSSIVPDGGIRSRTHLIVSMRQDVGGWYAASAHMAALKIA